MYAWKQHEKFRSSFNLEIHEKAEMDEHPEKSHHDDVLLSLAIVFFLKKNIHEWQIRLKLKLTINIHRFLCFSVQLLKFLLRCSSNWTGNSVYIFNFESQSGRNDLKLGQVRSEFV